MAPVLLIPRDRPRRGWQCLTCGEKFARGERSRFERHAIGCERRNEHIARDLSVRNRLGIFGGVPIDVELEAWVKRHAQAIIENRLKM